MSKATIKRKYSAKDEVMLIVLAVILKNSTTNLAELTLKNPNWTAAFIAALQLRVDDAFKNILGLDPKGNQRDATDIVQAMQLKVLPLLSSFSLFLRPAFKDNNIRRNEILTKLGFSSFYAKAEKKNIPALIELLFQFSSSMTPALKTEIIASKDISAADIDAIIAFTQTLKNSNINQKTFQTTSKTITSANVEVLNQLYEDVVTYYSVLVSDYFKKKKSATVDSFRFGKIKKEVNNLTKKVDTPPLPTPPTL